MQKIGATSPTADSGILILDSRSHDSAASNCAALGEQLWSPAFTKSSIQPNLDYLTYEGKYPADQLYWIASNGAQTQAISGTGVISNVSSHLHLPVLCTQSAPFSNSSYVGQDEIHTQDTSERWRVTVHSNNEYITG